MYELFQILAFGVVAIGVLMLVGLALGRKPENIPPPVAPQAQMKIRPSSKRELKSFSGGHYIEIDVDLNRVIIGQKGGRLSVPTRFVYDFSEIIAVSVVRDGITATTVNKGNLAGRALVGGVLLGGLGAVVGALSASSTSREKISRLALQIRVNNFSNPLHEVVLLDLGKNGIDVANPGIRHLISEAATFCAILENAMLQSQSASEDLRSEAIDLKPVEYLS